MIERQVVARRKVKYYLLIASALAYSAVIHGSRSVLVYQIIVLGCYILFKKGSSKRKIAMWVLAGLLVVIFINSTMFSTFVETFTNSTGEYAGSAESRFASVWFLFLNFCNRLCSVLVFLLVRNLRLYYQEELEDTYLILDFSIQLLNMV